MNLQSSSYELAKKLNDQTLQKIENDIENIYLDTKSPLDLTLKLKKQIITDLQKQKLGIIAENKQKKMTQLKLIERQEHILQKSLVKKKSRTDRLQRSEFTLEEMKEIKKVMRRKKKFQESLKQRQENFQKFIEEQIKIQEQIKQKHLNQKCEKRRRELQIERLQIKKRREERQQQYEEEKQRFNQIKKRKQLFQVFQEKWKILEEKEEEDKLMRYKIQASKKKLDTKQLQEHERKYLEMSLAQKNQRQRHLEQILRNSNVQLPHIYSKFYKKAQEQKHLALEQQKMKEEKRLENVEKQKIFSKIVKEIYLPKIKLVEKDFEMQQNVKKVEPLTFQDMNKLGNDYMHTIHDTIKQKTASKDKLTQIEFGGHSKYYKNYLNDMKKSKNKSQNSLSTEILQKVMQSNLTEEKKLEKIKSLVNKKQNMQKLKDKDVIESIRGKLLVLREFLR